MKRKERFHKGLLRMHLKLAVEAYNNCHCVHCREYRKLAELCYEIDDYLEENMK